MGMEDLWLAEMLSAESGIDPFSPQARTLSLHLIKSSFGERACVLNPGMRFIAAHTSTGRTQILAHTYIKDGRKVLRARPPDHNGGAIHPVDHGKARDPRLRSEFCPLAFPCPAQGACGLRDGRKRTRRAAASGAAR